MTDNNSSMLLTHVKEVSSDTHDNTPTTGKYPIVMFSVIDINVIHSV